VFEQIKLSDTQPLAELPDPIQKLMSAPVLAEDATVLGVLQISRKGMTPGIAGPDFSGADLRLLESVARRVALLMEDFDVARRRVPEGVLRMREERKSGKRASA
jgi:GAF domain-containing protein